LEPSSGSPSGSMVERLSGKPIELGLASPKVGGSWQGMWFSHAKLVPSPEGQVSWWGVPPVIPCRSGAQQSMRDVGLEGKGCLQGMDLAQLKRRGSL
jgi:hypothetical protein